MIKVGLSFINNELKNNMDRLRIVKQNDSLTIEQRNKRIEKANRAEFLRDLVYSFQYSDGLVMREKHGVIIKQAEPYSFYRGENRLFDTCKSSFYRKNSGDNIAIKRLISEMRIVLLDRVIRELDLIKHWGYCDIFPEFIAQHYGLDTEYLDVTGNFLVAMFFAVSRYDEGLHKYVPITDEYINSHPEYKVGYFYKKKNADRFVNQFSETIQIGDIIPIGFQPFMRCSAQFGYMIKCDENYDLAKDNNYDKYCFNQSSALSKYIYDKCKQGKTIMPYEGLTKILSVIDRIKTTKKFDIETFHKAVNCCGFINQEEDLLKALKLLEITIVDAINIDELISKEQITLINDDYRDFDFKNYYGLETWTRPVVFGNESKNNN